MRRGEYRWDDLKVLLALIRRGSLAGAGQVLGLNASTVGRRLDGLEKALGARLFERGRDGVVPTPAAETLRVAAEALERGAADVSHALVGHERAPEGTVRLSGPPGIITLVVAPLVGRLRKRHPRLRLELDANPREVDLGAREADLALRLRRPTSGDLVAVKLAEGRSTVFVGPDVRTPARLDDPASIDWVTWLPDLVHGDAAWVREHAPPERIAVEAASFEVIVAAARGGAGAVLAPTSLGARAGLRELPLGRKLAEALAARPPQPLFLVAHRAVRKVPRVDAVFRFLAEEAGVRPPR